jgi:hypothetical protein
VKVKVHSSVPRSPTKTGYKAALLECARMEISGMKHLSGSMPVIKEEAEDGRRRS